MNDISDPRYTTLVNKRWFPDMIGGVDSSGSSETYSGILGFPIRGLVIDGVEKYRVATRDSGWLDYKTSYDKENYAGDGSSIVAVDIVDPHIIYMTHSVGGDWSKALYGSECDADKRNQLHTHPIDAIQILRL